MNSSEMTIQQVIETSKKYHGNLDPKLPAVASYLDSPTKYMCAIGCNLQSPKDLEEYGYLVDEYSIDRIINSIKTNDSKVGSYNYSEEPLIKEAMKNDKFLEQLKTIQNLHDNSRTVGQYLEKLNNFNYEL